MRRLFWLLACAALGWMGGGAMVSAQTAFEGLAQIELTAKNLEALLDQQVPSQLKTHHIPGAAIAVVKDGRLLLAKGYGFADLEHQTPVIADKTLLHTGSVVKTR